MHPVILLALYVAVAFFPLGAAMMLGYPPRSFRDELSSALALMAFSGLLMEFVLSGRFKAVSGRIGIDVTMRFHQLIARSLTLFILVHPFLYTSGVPAYPIPSDTMQQTQLGLTFASFVTGLVAWLALMLLVILAIYRNRSGWSYETWRLSHGIAAIVFAVFATHHTLHAGRYSETPLLTAYWLTLLAIAIATMVWVYFITPLRLMQHPYRVKSVRQAALKTWEVAIEPTSGAAVRFEPGQFVWLTLNRSPFSIVEHPFSISSSPGRRPIVEFLIKEAGDATSRIGQLPVGSAAYIDGPHGAMTLRGRTGTGIVFIAGGIGIAPMLSLLRHLSECGETRPLMLIYGNRREEQIVARDELENLGRTLDLELVHVLSEPTDDWQGLCGVLDRDILEACLPAADRAGRLYFVCGPAVVIDSVERDLVGMGVPLKQIVAEKFSYD